MTSIPDPIQAGLARGWPVRGGDFKAPPAETTVDVAIVGSGAGGGVTAEILARAGLKVLIIEEGPLRSSRDFKQREADAYPQLYQESAGRKTADKAITILQGRCVGGSTTVNWTSSFRTPPATLQHWSERLGLQGLDAQTMAPWFEQAERRLHIQDWEAEPNANNQALARGAQKLGLAAPRIRRNVHGCWNLGSCGMGCPTNAKQSMLVTTLPGALDAGAELWVQTRVERLAHDGHTVQALHCVPVDLSSAPKPGAFVVRARHVVLAGGAINTPALLLRSNAPDPHQRLGRRTFLHPTVISSATFEERVEGWSGAPQTVYSDHFLETEAIDGPLGFKLEAPPLYPVIMATTMAGFGREQAKTLQQFPHTQVLLSLLRDGFHPDSPGGHVTLRRDGSPTLDYPITATLKDGIRRAFLTMAEIQFAAGAREVQPIHEDARPYRSWRDAKAAIGALELRPLSTRIVSAHVMGGCALSSSPEHGVTQTNGQHWQLNNLSIHDGSLFPTSIGANPQLSIYGLVARLATGLAERLGHPVAAWA
ncbi:GMC family oxidoreductase [Inhella gelatinilytica]|uniref:GMC family oxidoreductase n=1 Tax=Inhella gelatinilytica TaxID=2795030 RepID=A0A931IXJ8_9BURK|nr:GMC family oxidoreductase [Inhella gelatinilytica]MBH9552478.1 GMC family oxidoreductase [Inhella gelatinilytica]